MPHGVHPVKPLCVPLGLALVAGLGMLALAPSRSPYWDSPGYVVQALTGGVGGLGFGRPMFAFASHAVATVWETAGGSPWHLETVLRIVWGAVTACAAPLTWHLARQLGLSRRGSILAGLAVALSPALAHAGGAVLTDGPAVTAFLVACVAGTRAAERAHATGAVPVLAAVGTGAALGVSIGLREQSIGNVLVIALLAMAAPKSTRLRLAAWAIAACALVTAALVTAAVFTEPGYLQTIRTRLLGMAHDRNLKTWTWYDLTVFSAWILSLGPVVAVAALLAFFRRQGELRSPRTALFAVAVPSLLQLLAMAVFQGTGYSPRYLVAALPGAIAIPGALALDTWSRGSRGRTRLAVAALIVPLTVAVPIVRARGASVDATLAAWPSDLAALPARTVVVSGQPCAWVPLIRELSRRDSAGAGRDPAWRPICPGWAWPVDLTSTLDEALRDGDIVALDLRADSWVGAEQTAARDEAVRYRRARSSDESAGRLRVWE